MDAAEAALIRQCQAGDKDAFRRLVKSHPGRAIGAATMLLGNRDAALAWSGFPATQHTDWSAASLLKQIPDAIYDRWEALYGRERTKTAWEGENPYAPAHFYKGYANTPPGIAEDGEGWLIGGNPTGAWAGHAHVTIPATLPPCAPRGRRCPLPTPHPPA